MHGILLTGCAYQCLCAQCLTLRAQVLSKATGLLASNGFTFRHYQLPMQLLPHNLSLRLDQPRQAICYSQVASLDSLSHIATLKTEVAHSLRFSYDVQLQFGSLEQSCIASLNLARPSSLDCYSKWHYWGSWVASTFHCSCTMTACWLPHSATKHCRLQTIARSLGSL